MGKLKTACAWGLKIAFVAVATAIAWHNVAAAIVAVAATILVVLFDRAKDVAEISFGVMRAKVERDMSEAEKLVRQLREFSTLQTKAVFSSAIRSGRFADATTWLFHQVKTLEASLREMGVSEDDIGEARREFVKFVVADAGSMAMGREHVPSHNGKVIHAEWKEALAKFPDRDPDRIQAFLERYGFMNQERRQRLDDMRWMIENNDVRDEEMYRRSLVPVPWDD